MHKGFLKAAAFIGALSVVLGAFGAHGLKQLLDEKSLAVYETAVRYQFYHVFALAAVGILYKEFPVKMLRYAGGLFLTGMLFFSGSLYLLTYRAVAHNDGFLWAGPITPLGGVLLIAAWICLALGIGKGK
ncbi:MAG: DUF423 domain-containing protein [Bacteroidota bacterium]|nr:DUF423 domain-containing protein [Bacteroidota bacterium]